MICKRCENVFNLEKGEIQWFKSQGLSIPTHCKSCLKIMKREKRGPEMYSVGDEIKNNPFSQLQDILQGGK